MQFVQPSGAYSVLCKGDTGGWFNFVVTVPFRTARREVLNYHLAWNGQRMARGSQWERFTKWNPQTAADVVAWLEAGMPS